MTDKMVGRMAGTGGASGTIAAEATAEATGAAPLDAGFDFDTPVDRSGTGSLKWDVAPGELPMWVADMDFKTAPAVAEALRARVGHGVFGYSIVPDAWADAVCGWWRERHGLAIDPASLVFCTGVVPAISSIVRKLTTTAENVLIQTPVYNIFFNSILNNGRRVLESPLVYDPGASGDADGAYRIDFDDLERKLADPQTTLMVLCNPHNPVGKIWDRETLARIGELAERHRVTVVSDEIHCDLTDPGFAYVPFAAASETCARVSVTCLAPTKAFNIAGLQTAAVMVPDPALRHKVWRALNTDEVAEPNAFAIDAAVAAFTRGAPWLDAVRAYIAENKRAARAFLEREVPQVRLVEGPATYLLWIDCRSVAGDSLDLCGHLRRSTGLILCEGSEYGAAGEGFVRMNAACPRARLEDGLRRFARGVASYRRG